MLGSDSIPNEILNGLRANGVCTLSVATERESIAAKQMSAKNGEICGHVKSFQDAELQPCPSIPSALDILTPGRRRPPAVDSSPVQMHCRLILDVPLQEAAQTDTNNQQNIPSMLLLQVDTYVIKGSIIWYATMQHTPANKSF